MLRRFFPLILSLITLFTVSAPALADTDYEISKYAMEVTILEDGSADVTETLIYAFDGEYNGILSLFDIDGTDGMENLTLSIDGVPLSPVGEMTYIPNTYTLTQDENLIEIRAYSPGEDDTRVVTYEYRLLGLAARYEDTGMILRSFIGENNAVSLQDAVVRVSFGTDCDIQAFAHGGMGADDITVGGNYVEFGPKTVYSDSSVEMRILFPASLIPDAPLTGGLMLDAALQEETRLIEEAELRARLTETAKYIFTAVYSLLFFLIWLLLARKYGLKHRLHETPDVRRLLTWPAAFAAAAVADEPDTDALSGSLMELVQLRRVRMEPVDKDLLFTLTDRSEDGLYPHHLRLIEWLFRDGDTLSLSSLNAGDDYDRARAFESGYASYCTQVTLDMLEQKLKYKNDALRITVNALIIILGALGAAFILIAGTPNVFLGCAVALMLFFLIFLMNRIRTLTDEGERLQADAAALLADGILPDTLHTYLPFYTALGMTEPLIETFQSADAESFPPYLFAGWHMSLHHLSGSMKSAHYHNASVPDPSASSSTTSSSGGSNGGGGGHGAW